MAENRNLKATHYCHACKEFKYECVKCCKCGKKFCPKHIKNIGKCTKGQGSKYFNNIYICEKCLTKKQEKENENT